MFGNHLHLFLVIIFVNLFCFAYCEIPRVVLCANPSCTEPISKAKGNLLYNPIEPNVLGFKRGTTIQIISKSKDKNGYWGAQIGNQRGFVPSSYVKETTVWKSNDQLMEVSGNLVTDNIPSDGGGGNVNLDNGLGERKIEARSESSDQIPAASDMGHQQTIPLANLLHGNIPIVSKEFVQPEVKIEPQNPINSEPTPVKTETQFHTTIVDDDQDDEEEDVDEDDEEIDAEDDVEELEDTNKIYNASDDALPIVNSENLAVKKETNKASTETLQSLDNAMGSSPGSSADRNLNIGGSAGSGENFQSSQGNDMEDNTEGSINIVRNKESLDLDDSHFSFNESKDDYSRMSNETIPIHDANNQSAFLNYSSDDSTSLNNETSPQGLGMNKLNESNAGSGDMPVIASVSTEDDVSKSRPKPYEQVPQENVISTDSPSTMQIPNEGTQNDIKTDPGNIEGSSNVLNTVNEESVKSTNMNNGVNVGTFVSASSTGSVDSSGGEPVVAQSSIRNDLSNDHSGQSTERVQVENTTPDTTGVPNSWSSHQYDTKSEPNEFVYGGNPSGQVSSDQFVLSFGAQAQINTNPVTEQPESDLGVSEATTVPSYTVDIKREAEGFTTSQIFSEEPMTQSLNYASGVTSEVVTEKPETATTEYIVSDSSSQISDDVAPTTPGPEVNTEASGFFSGMSDSMLGWVGLGSKQAEGDTVLDTVPPHVTEEIYPTSGMAADKGQVVPDGACANENCVEAPSGSSVSSFSLWSNGKNMNFTSSNTLMYLIVTAVTVLLFTLGYYFIEQFRNDGPLIAKVNKLEQELLVSSKECLILKDELTLTKEKLNLFETSSNDKIITALQSELEDSKKVRAELENNIEVLQQELETATEAGLDLNRMLSEVLTQKGGSESLMASVEHLQQQLNDQQKIIDDMTSKLIAKTQENQELQDELLAAGEKIESLESEIEDMRGNLNVHLKDNEDVIADLTAKNKELQLKINQINDTKEKEAAKLRKSQAELEKNLKSMTDALKVKEEECNNLKESIRKMKMKDSKSLDTLFDASRMKAELAQSESENKSLKDQLKVGEDRFAKLESTVKKLEDELEKWKQCSSEAEKEKTEAQTRLEVLSNYFKEKETQLQKELGLREAQWVQKQGDDSTIYERMKSLEEEIDSYKSQNEALKKEILDQERGLKTQITTLEKKAHENWIAARQAERKLEESKQEAGQLRNKLTLMEKNMTNDLESGHRGTNEELNGGEAMSPLIHDTSSPILFPPLPLDPNSSSLMPPGFIPPPMFMPPPPGGFMPPPPFLPGDHRPPPLGRMSSPPLNNRFSPPPPDYAYDRMSTPPLSPSSRNYRSPTESDRERDRYRHRTPTSPSFRGRNWEEGPSGGMPGFRPIASERDIRRDHKGGSNLSSGHSSESLDKSSRHSGRV